MDGRPPLSEAHPLSLATRGTFANRTLRTFRFLLRRLGARSQEVSQGALVRRGFLTSLRRGQRMEGVEDGVGRRDGCGRLVLLL